MFILLLPERKESSVIRDAMNNLEITLKWNKEIPFGLRDRDLSRVLPGVDIQDGIKVTLDFEKHIANLKKKYQGTLTSMQSVHGYLAHIVWITSGHNNPLVKSVEKRDGIAISYEYSIVRFNSEDKGIKTLSIPFGKLSESPENLKSHLEALERKWFVEPRRQLINDCDYWYGFFGTSANKWSHSLYPHGNPGEKALQLAHDLEHGIRTDDWCCWYFPGTLGYYNNNFTEEQNSVMNDINKILMDNQKLGKNISHIVSRLRECAEHYQEVSSK